MNTTQAGIDPAEAVIVAQACERVGVDCSTSSPLHQHATSVWLAPRAGCVVRLSRSTLDRAVNERALAITQWLTERGFPATEPLNVDQPVDVAGTKVTFWRYYPQPPTTPDSGALGALLRRLHELPDPPVDLGDYIPLQGLGKVLATADVPLPEADRAFLAARRAEVVAAYANLTSILGTGFIHGDAYPGNTLWDGTTVRLGDWEEVARGPRELDLVNTHQGARFGRSAEERQRFNEAYGWDVTTWGGFATLREMRDLHTLGAYIDRAAAGDEHAAAELRHRVKTLQTGDVTARWNIG